jgi:DNA polymerase III sliding clamp (beta) subunit (PCNA family)
LVNVNRKLLQNALANLNQSLKKPTSDPLIGVFSGNTLNLYQEGYLSVWESVPLEDVQDAESVTFAVKGNDFYSVVSRLASETIGLKINEKSMTIRGGRSSVRMAYTESFVDGIPDASVYGLVEVPKDFFNALISARRFMAKSEHQPNLTCVYFKHHNGSMDLASTDGVHLYSRKFALDAKYDSDFEFDVMVPDTCIDPLAKIFSGVSCKISVSNRGHIYIESDTGTKVLTSSFNGQFPYDSMSTLIDNDGDPLFKTSKEDFVNAIQLGDNISDGDKIYLNYDQGNITLSFADIRMESEIFLENAKETNPFDEFSIGTKLLLECVTSLGDDIAVRQQESGMLWMTSDGKTITLLHKFAN